MESNIVGHFANPARTKIFLEIHSGQPLTAKKLLEKLPDISQPTLYRHIKAMLDDGIIQVAEEKRVRGVVEKSYSAKFDWTADIERIVTENDGPGYMKLFLQYITGIVGEFSAYCQSGNVDIVNDGVGFTVAPICATDEEFQEAMVKIGEILGPMVTAEPSQGRKLRSLCMVTLPPKKKE